MRRVDVRVIWGLLLVGAGALFLLQNLQLIPADLPLFWAIVFGAGGGVFVYVYLSNRLYWWALIPGFSLLGIAATILVTELAPRAPESLGGALVLGSISLSFWLIYLVHREHWWAVIPGGALATLTLMVLLTPVLEGVDEGGLLFLGLGATFGLLYLLPTAGGEKLRWAIYPAIVLLVMGVLISAAAESALRYLWPAALILGGLYLILRTFIRQRNV